MNLPALSSLRITCITLLLVAVIYPLLIRGIAWIMPGKGEGELLTGRHGINYKNIGQSFTSDAYFQGRPSAVSYNAAGSGGSNKGPANPEYLQQVRNRIDTFRVHNPAVLLHQIPVDLVTASGSGLDPHISVQAARVQVPRIVAKRTISQQKVQYLIDSLTEHPLAGWLGPSKINVLQLNLALDKLK